jgi:hypothetical protein
MSDMTWYSSDWTGPHGQPLRRKLLVGQSRGPHDNLGRQLEANWTVIRARKGYFTRFPGQTASLSMSCDLGFGSWGKFTVNFTLNSSQPPESDWNVSRNVTLLAHSGQNAAVMRTIKGLAPMLLNYYCIGRVKNYDTMDGIVGFHDFHFVTNHFPQFVPIVLCCVIVSCSRRSWGGAI